MVPAYLMGLAFLLGIKHSYDTDHLIAVSGILLRVRSFAAAIKIGVSWAVGHMLTASTITILLFFFRESILSFILPHFEMLVGAMLVVLGVFGLGEFVFRRTEHVHTNAVHAHVGGGSEHTHRYMFGIGIVHGLASNDELLTLFVASLGIVSFGGILASIAFFTIGVVVGMVIFCMLFSVTRLHVQNATLSAVLSVGTSLISSVYGLSMITGFHL